MPTNLCEKIKYGLSVSSSTTLSSPKQHLLYIFFFSFAYVYGRHPTISGFQKGQPTPHVCPSVCHLARFKGSTFGVMLNKREIIAPNVGLHGAGVWSGHRSFYTTLQSVPRLARLVRPAGRADRSTLRDS